MSSINMTQKALLTFVMAILIMPTAYADSYSASLHAPSTPDHPEVSSTGSFTSDLFTGAAVFSYPIGVPPGTNGLAPSLALSYNSFSRNAYPELAGSGWSFSESYVQRDVQYSPADTSNDRFKLVLNGASYDLVYDSSDGTYHTETESYLNIRLLSGGSNSYGQYWEVRTKDGTAYRFGYNADSELASNQYSYAWRWYLDQVKDTHDNRIFFSYRENPYTGDLGVSYLNTIEYNTGRERRIEFSYQSLPRAWSVFDNGQKVRRTQRLSEMRIYTNSALVRSYAIAYTTNELSTRSYISSITERGSDGSSIPAASFAYTPQPKGWVEDAVLASRLPDAPFASDNGDGGGRLIDVNSDGVVDVTRGFASNLYTYLGTYGGSFALSSGFAVPSDATFVKWYDGLYLDNGVRLGDFNGDGLVDLIKGHNNIYDHESSRAIWQNTGSGWSLSPRSFITDFATIDRSSGIYHSTDEGVQLADLNGDGFDDAIKAKSGSSKSAWLNTGAGWSSASSWNLPSGIYFIESDGDDEGTRLVDMNGDGLVDTYYADSSGTKSLWLNTGAGWASDSAIPLTDLPNNIDTGKDDEGVRIVDINDDGLPDVLHARGSTKDSHMNIGEGWYFDGTWNVPAEAEFVTRLDDNEGTRLADIDGDGDVDIAREESISGSLPVKMAWKNVGSPMLLKQVNLQTGGRIDIEYANSANTTSSKINQWVVSSVSRTDLLAHNEPSSYLDCVPAACAAGFQDNGIVCSSSSCYRRCEISDCGAWSTVMDSRNPWSNYDIGSSVSGRILFYFSSFRDGYCYKVDTYSDNNIISSSNIVGEDTALTDSAIALSWKMRSGVNQPWGDDCLPDRTGDLLNRQHRYLIDDSDDTGNDYNSAGDLGGSWTGYCMPASKGCTGFDNCTTSCVGDSWDMWIMLSPDLPQRYARNDADDALGACRAEEIGSSAETSYIHFSSSKYVGMRVYEAPMTVTSSNPTCSRTAVTKTSYSYSGGLYDYQDKEFRGFSEVRETRPDNSVVIHRFFQDDALKGREHQTEIRDSAGRLVQMAYNTWRSTARPGYAVVELGVVQTELYDGLSTPKSYATSFTYDAWGNLIEKWDQGDLSVTGDERYERSTYLYSSGPWIMNRPQTTSVFDRYGTSKLKEALYRYDGLAYGAAPTKGDVTREELWLSGSTNPATTRTYDSYGNILTETDANSHTTTYAYDTTHTFIASTTNALSQTTSYSYDLGTGNLLSETDPNGHTTSYAYDAFGRKTKVIRPYDSATLPTTQIVYELDGTAPEKVTVKSREVYGSSATFDVINYYDGFGKVVQSKKESEGQFSTIDFRYDSSGRLADTSSPYFTTSSAYSAPDFTHATSYDYDALGRKTRTTYPDTRHKDVAYERNLVTLTDESGHQKELLNDAYGKIILVTEHDSASEYETSYDYDALGNLLGIEDEQGNSWSFSYDTLGRKIGFDDPDLGAWSFSYDSAGNIVGQADARGIVTNFTYDAMNRLLSKVSGSERLTYVYDTSKIGALRSVSAGNMTKYFLYDNRLREVDETVSFASGPSFRTVYQYDAMDRPNRIDIFSGSTMLDSTTYSYSDDKLNSIAGVITNIDYNAMGLPSLRQYSNSLSTSLGYNEMFRVSSISTGSGLQSLGYSYTYNGNVLAITDSTHGSARVFGYDDLDRLTRVTSTGSAPHAYDIQYQYDAIGNMVRVTPDFSSAITFNYTSSPVAHSPARIS